MGKNNNPFRNLITSIFQGKKKWINKMCWLELIQMHYSSSSLKFHSKKSSNILFTHWFVVCCLWIHLICLASISMIKNEMQMHFMLRIRANANKMKIHQCECLHFINKNRIYPWCCDWCCDEKWIKYLNEKKSSNIWNIWEYRSNFYKLKTKINTEFKSRFVCKAISLKWTEVLRIILRCMAWPSSILFVDVNCFFS